MRQLLKRCLIWAAPLELVVLIMFWRFPIDVEGGASGWVIAPMQVAIVLHSPAIQFWAAGELPISFVVLNGYLVLVLVLMLTTSAYRAIRLWLTRP